MESKNTYKQTVSEKDYLYIDMHIHTEFSKNEEVDVEVRDLLDTAQAQAKNSGKRVCIAITDHESMLGCVEAVKIMKENPQDYDMIDFIPGIEINTSLKSVGLDEDGHAIYHKCHMLGYGFDIEDENLLAYSHLAYLKTYSNVVKKRITSGRQLLSAKKSLEEKYGKRIPFSKFYDLRHEGCHEELYKKFIEITTKEFGVSKEEIDAEIEFKFNYNGTTSVDPTKESKQDIIYMMDVIHDAGGIISVAHANSIRYKHPEKMSYKPKEELVLDFINKVQELSNNGIDAIELFHSENTNGEIFNTLYNYVKSHNLFVTCGSDYHGSLHVGKRISRVCSKRFEKASHKFDGNSSKKSQKRTYNRVVALQLIKYLTNKDYLVNQKYNFSLYNTSEQKILTIDEIKRIISKFSTKKTHSKVNNNHKSAVREAREDTFDDVELGKTL